MKKISLFLLLALPVCLYAQQPIFPLFAQNPRWRIESWNYNGGLPPNIQIFEYFYQKDTVVVGKTYSKLMVKVNEGATRFEGLIRNEGKKTFIRKMFGNEPSSVLSEEYGLYNFDLKGGITEEYTFGPTVRFFPRDSFFLAIFSSTDSTVFMGQKRKRIFANYEHLSIGRRSTQPLEWIEGFGIFNNPFYPLQCFNCADVFYRTMCMDMNGTTIYRDTVRYPNCLPIRVSTNDLQKSKITISPNPVADVIHLNNVDNVDNVDKIQLYSFDGRLIQRFEQADLSKLSVAHLPNGIYFMAFYFKDGLFDTRKIVKAH